MHKLNPTVRKELERRGIEFAPLLTPDNWNKLAPNIPAQTAFDVEGMYRDFNGFSHPDHKSQIKLWTMQDIITKNKEIIVKKSASYIIIGDVMIEANYIFYDKKSSSIIIDGYDDGNFASISDMLEYLAKGHFDVI